MLERDSVHNQTSVATGHNNNLISPNQCGSRKLKGSTYGNAIFIICVKVVSHNLLLRFNCYIFKGEGRCKCAK